MRALSAISEMGVEVPMRKMVVDRAWRSRSAKEVPDILIGSGVG